MPGHAKMVSMITAPLSMKVKASPHAVSTGISALRRACFHTTMPSARPLARAVRT